MSTHSETIAAAPVFAYCEPGEDVTTCARRAFGESVIVDTMMRGAQGRTLVGAVATRRTGPHFAVYAAVTPAPRYVIVNARGRLADDLGDMGRGADFGWPTEADAEAALENLAETTGWDVGSYSVREATGAEIAANT